MPTGIPNMIYCCLWRALQSVPSARLEAALRQGNITLAVTKLFMQYAIGAVLELMRVCNVRRALPLPGGTEEGINVKRGDRFLGRAWGSR